MLILNVSAFQFAKNNFDSIHTKKSIRIDSTRQVNTVLLSDEKWGRGQIDVWTLIFRAFVPAAVASTVQSQSNIAYRLQAVVESNGPILGKGIRINSLSELNRTDSNRELECTTERVNFPVFDHVLHLPSGIFARRLLAFGNSGASFFG